MPLPYFSFDPSKAGDEYKEDVDFILKSINRHQVVIFGIPWQTDTRLVQWLFDQREIPYLPIETDELSNQVQVEEVLYRCCGGNTLLPYVFVNQKYVGSRYEIWNHWANFTLRELVGMPPYQRQWPPWYPDGQNLPEESDPCTPEL